MPFAQYRRIDCAFLHGDRRAWHSDQTLSAAARKPTAGVPI
jgi:hypothetical protein